MIIKKLLMLFCLMTVSISINCMDTSLLHLKIQQAISTGMPLETLKNFDQLDVLIEAKNEEIIIEFLDNNQAFTENNLSTILLKLAELQLDKCVDHLLGKDIVLIESDIAQLIIIALDNNDIERVKILTKFNEYFDKNGTLLLEKYLNYLNELKLDADSIFNRIFFNDKKNYKIERDFRYLIKILSSINELGSNNYIEEILGFINSAPLQELDAQDRLGRTALLQAAFLWDRPPFDDNKKIARLQKDQTKIIHALLEREANPKLKHSVVRTTFFDSYFVKFHSMSASCEICQRLVYDQVASSYEHKIKEAARNSTLGSKRVTSSNNKALKKPINLKSKIAVGAGVAVLAIAAVYFGYDYFNNSKINSTIKLN